MQERWIVQVAIQKGLGTFYYAGQFLYCLSFSCLSFHIYLVPLSLLFGRHLLNIYLFACVRLSLFQIKGVKRKISMKQESLTAATTTPEERARVVGEIQTLEQELEDIFAELSRC